MKLKATITAKSSENIVSITVESNHTGRVLTQWEQKIKHEERVNGAHDLLRARFDAREIRIR